MSEHIIETEMFGDTAFVTIPPKEPKEEIVRCRDCKFYTPESMTREERVFGVYENVWEPGGCFNPERCSHGGDPFGEWYVVGINTEPDGFCAWGERKGSA